MPTNFDPATDGIAAGTPLVPPGGSGWQILMGDACGVTVQGLDRDNCFVVLAPSSRYPTMIADLEAHGIVSFATGAILDPVHKDFFTKKLQAALEQIGNPQPPMPTPWYSAPSARWAEEEHSAAGPTRLPPMSSGKLRQCMRHPSPTRRPDGGRHQSQPHPVACLGGVAHAVPAAHLGAAGNRKKQNCTSSPPRSRSGRSLTESPASRPRLCLNLHGNGYRPPRRPLSAGNPVPCRCLPPGPDPLLFASTGSGGASGHRCTA